MNHECVQGDLLNQPVEVIVNAWNRNFIPWWLLLPQGVSGAIKKKGGVSPFRELSRVGIMGLGQAVLTRAGKLPYKAIIHVAGLNAFWRASPASIRISTRNAVELAAKHSFKSIAFPLIGAGTGGFKPEEAKKLMLDELGKLESPVHALIVEFRRA